jgi:hypothetical protein
LVSSRRTCKCKIIRTFGFLRIRNTKRHQQNDPKLIIVSVDVFFCVFFSKDKGKECPLLRHSLNTITITSKDGYNLVGHMDSDGGTGGDMGSGYSSDKMGKLDKTDTPDKDIAAVFFCDVCHSPRGDHNHSLDHSDYNIACLSSFASKKPCRSISSSLSS